MKNSILTSFLLALGGAFFCFYGAEAAMAAEVVGTSKSFSAAPTVEAPASVICSERALATTSMQAVLMTSGNPMAMLQVGDSLKAAIETACKTAKTSREVVQAFTKSCLEKCGLLSIRKQTCEASCGSSSARGDIFLEGYSAASLKCPQRPPTLPVPSGEMRPGA